MSNIEGLSSFYLYSCVWLWWWGVFKEKGHGLEREQGRHYGGNHVKLYTYLKFN